MFFIVGWLEAVALSLQETHVDTTPCMTRVVSCIEWCRNGETLKNLQGLHFHHALAVCSISALLAACTTALQHQKCHRRSQDKFKEHVGQPKVALLVFWSRRRLTSRWGCVQFSMLMLRYTIGSMLGASTPSCQQHWRQGQRPNQDDASKHRSTTSSDFVSIPKEDKPNCAINAE